MRMPMNSSIEFAQKLGAAHAGSSEALGQVLTLCRPYLLRIARQQLGSDLRAKSGESDLVQETFLEAHQTFERFHGTSARELYAWLCCMLRHRAAMVGRQFRTTAKRRLGCEIPSCSPRIDDSGTPSTQATANEQIRLVIGAIARLSDDHRRVLALRYEQGLKFEEIGQLMGRSADAARMLWTRALEAAKYELQPA
jgi:RNA polymerase sigma-70 factor (ECF subfamily)